MPSFSIETAHSLGKEEARGRLERFLGKIQEEYANQVSDLKQNWEGDRLDFSFTTYGFQISGAAELFDDAVKLKGTLPMAAMLFKGRIEQTIREYLGRVLS